MEWIIHLDTDELIYPAGNREYSLRQLLSDVPGNVDMVIFPNYVSKKVLCRFRFFFFFIHDMSHGSILYRIYSELYSIVGAPTLCERRDLILAVYP